MSVLYYNISAFSFSLSVPPGLFPAVLNLASNAVITANATCGTKGPEMYCKLVEHVPGQPARNPQCRMCDQRSRNPNRMCANFCFILLASFVYTCVQSFMDFSEPHLESYEMIIMEWSCHQRSIDSPGLILAVMFTHTCVLGVGICMIVKIHLACNIILSSWKCQSRMISSFAYLSGSLVLGTISIFYGQDLGKTYFFGC